MKLFNSIQIAVLFSAMPWVVNWLANAEFRHAGPLFWVAVMAYVIQFILVTAAIYKATKDWDW